MLAEFSEEVASIFVSQWFEVRGPWQLEDWNDRVRATLSFYEQNVWNEEAQRWFSISSGVGLV